MDLPKLEIFRMNVHVHTAIYISILFWKFVDLHTIDFRTNFLVNTAIFNKQAYNLMDLQLNIANFILEEIYHFRLPKLLNRNINLHFNQTFRSIFQQPWR